MNIQPQVNETLNELLRYELTVINQYFLHARLLKHWGYKGLGQRIYKQSIQAMKNADDLIERIFLLEGLPNLQDLGKLLIGEDMSEILSCDLNIAKAQHEAQVKAIALLEQAQDYVSRALIEAFIEEQEEYIDWLETQQESIQSIGLQNYLQRAVDYAE